MARRFFLAGGIVSVTLAAWGGWGPSPAWADITYVTNTMSATTVSVVPDGGGAASTFATGFSAPEGIVFNRSTDLLFVGNNTTRVIDEVNSQGVVTPLATVPAGNAGDSLGGMTLGPSGNIYASLQGSGRVERVTPSGGTSLFASGFGDPQGLAFDPSGNDLYVADLIGNEVYKSVNGGTPLAFAGVINPYGIAVDANGNVYVSSAAGYIDEFSSSGASDGIYAIVDTPLGITFDSEGQLLVASSNIVTGAGNTVYAVAPGGGSVTTYATGFSGPTYVADGPVPEPAMLGPLGVAAATVLGRRRR